MWINSYLSVLSTAYAVLMLVYIDYNDLMDFGNLHILNPMLPQCHFKVFNVVGVKQSNLQQQQLNDEGKDAYACNVPQKADSWDCFARGLNQTCCFSNCQTSPREGLSNLMAFQG